MALTIIGVLIFVLLVYLLLMPLVLFIDTANNQYYIQAKGLAIASIEGDDTELLRVKLKIFFWHFYFYPLRYLGASKKRRGKSSEKSKRRKGKYGNKLTITKGLRVLRSFTVKKFYFELDTGDWVANSKLYPIFKILNYRYGGFSINFQGRNQLCLQVVNRPIHILRSFVNF